MLYLDREGWDAALAKGPCFEITPFSQARWRCSGRGYRRPCPGPILTGPAASRRSMPLPSLRANGQSPGPGTIILAAWSFGSRERLSLMLKEHGIREARAVATADEARALPRGTVALVVLPLERGFVAERLALVGEQDLLGERIGHRRRKRADQFIAEATEIAAGDLVVHQDYGIGRYDGLETIDRFRRPARLPPPDLRRPARSSSSRSRTSTSLPLRQRSARVSRSTSSAAPLANPQGQGQEAHPGHGRRADPHRRRTPAARRPACRRRRRQLRRVLRPLPLRRDRGPGPRHRRRAGGSCRRQTDGPADLRRCRLRQDRSRTPRRLRRRDVRRPGRGGRPRPRCSPASTSAPSPRVSPGCR